MDTDIIYEYRAHDLGYQTALDEFALDQAIEDDLRRVLLPQADSVERLAEEIAAAFGDGTDGLIALQAFLDDEAEHASPSSDCWGRDHWGDPFPTLGEPNEAELQPDPERLAAALERGKQAATQQKRRKKRIQLPDYGGAFPLSAAHVSAKGFWPDALEDTRHARKERAKDSGLLTALEELQAHAPQGMEWGKLTLSKLKDSPLYSKDTLRLARLEIARYMRSVGETACVWKLERGRGGGFHVELVVPAGSGGGLKGLKAVTDIYGLAAYLSKPPDAWSCTPDEKARQIWSSEDLERGQVAACEEYLTRDRGPSGKERLQFWGSMGLGKGRR
ncbi:hypothetical protein [Deinococcus sp. NW-56]|uniref:hypothetical protein n=1 Tax=Deinococcus sp. NW-56 TaxID=2080419 RepID=UPI000CF3E74B|nr:hypothetical protein [Deinococcus sp. NW-56]